MKEKIIYNMSPRWNQQCEIIDAIKRIWNFSDGSSITSINKLNLSRESMSDFSGNVKWIICWYCPLIEHRMMFKNSWHWNQLSKSSKKVFVWNPKDWCLMVCVRFSKCSLYGTLIDLKKVVVGSTEFISSKRRLEVSIWLYFD